MKSSTQEAWQTFLADPREENFASLYDQTKSRVYAICLRILRNPEDARDAFQSTYCRLIALVHGPASKLGAEDGRDLMDQLAVREADNLRKRRLRRMRKEVAMQNLPEAAHPSDLADRIAADRELSDRVETLVSLLPDKYRIPVLLHFFQGMTQSEIARSLNEPIRTVSGRIERGLKKLRPLFRRAGLGECAKVFGAVVVANHLLEPPAALGASVVFAHAKAVLAMTGAGSALAGSAWKATTSAAHPLLAKLTFGGVVMMKAKVAVVLGLLVLGIAGLLFWESARSTRGSKPNKNLATETNFRKPPRISPRSLTSGSRIPSAADANRSLSLDAVASSTANPVNSVLQTQDLLVHVVWKGEDQKPVEGGMVMFAADSDEATSEVEAVPGPTGASAKIVHGKALLRIPARWTAAQIRIEHPEAAAKISSMTLPTEEPFRVELERGATIYGTVFNGETQQRLPRAEVRILGTDHAVQTGSDGSFSIPRVPSGYIRIAGSLGVLRSYTREKDIIPVLLSPGEHRHQALFLRPHPILYGLIRNMDTHTSISGALVSCVSSEIPSSIHSDKMGRYRIEGLDTGEKKLSGMASGYVRRQAIIQMPAREDMRLDFDLEPAAQVQVLVSSSDKQPVQGACIGAVGSGAYEGGAKTTDAFGRVLIDGVSRKDAPPFRASKDGYKSSMDLVPIFESGKPLASLQFILEPTSAALHAFSGCITGDSGEPIAGAKITWTPSFYGRQEGEGTTTDKDGFYHLDIHKIEQFCTLVVTAKGWIPQWRQYIEPGTAAAPRKEDFILKSGHWIAGVVVNKQNQPVPQVRVEPVVLDGNRNRISWPKATAWLMFPSITDSQGRFHIEDMPEKEITLSLTAKEKKLAPLEQPFAVDREHTIVLQPMGVILGQVLDKDTRKPIKDYNVKLHCFGLPSDRTQIGQTFSNADGRFVLEQISPGKECGVIVKASGYALKMEKEWKAAAPDEAKEKIIYLAKPNHLEGQLVDFSTRKPIPGASVAYAVFDDTYYLDWNQINESSFIFINLQKVQSAADGSFSFEEGEDRGTLFIQSKAYQRRVLKPVERLALEHSSGKLLIPLKQGASISGICLRKGVPFPGAKLTLMLSGGPSEESNIPKPDPDKQADANGAYRWDGLAAGKYYLALQEQYSAKRIFPMGKQFEVAVGEEKIVNMGDGLGPWTLRGRVLNGSQALPGIVVNLTPRFSWAYKSMQACTDPEGRFFIEGLSKGTYTVNLGEYPPTVESTVEVTGDVEKEFQLRPSHAVTVRLKFPAAMSSEKGPSGSAILLAAQPDLLKKQSGADAIQPSGNASFQADRGPAVFTGRFRGEYKMQFQLTKDSKQFVFLSLDRRFQINNLEGDQDLGEVEVPVPPGSLRLQVNYDPPTPSSFVHAVGILFANDGKEETGRFAFDAEPGEQVIPNLPTGTHRLLFHAPAWTVEPPSQIVTIAPGASPVVAVRFHPEGALRGQVCDATDIKKPVQLRRVLLTGNGENRTIDALREFPDLQAHPELQKQDIAAKSFFNVKNLKKGVYSITIEADGYKPLSVAQSVELGKDNSMSISLQPSQ